MKYVSSVMNCFDADNYCPVCQFIGGDRSEKTLLEVIARLDRAFGACEKTEGFLFDAVAKLNQELKEKDVAIKRILDLPQEEFENGMYFTMDVVHMDDIKEILGIE